MPIEYTFALFVAKNFSKTIQCANILSCFKMCSRKLSPMPLPTIFKFSTPHISSRIKCFLIISHLPLQNKLISTRNAFKVFCWLLFSIRISQSVES